MDFSELANKWALKAQQEHESAERWRQVNNTQAYCWQDRVAAAYMECATELVAALTTELDEGEES
jgi:hypothetical protein